MRWRHTVTHYRPEPTGRSEMQEETYRYRRLERHRNCTIQPVGGEVAGGDAGNVATATQWAFGPTGWDLQQGDGLLIERGTMEGWRFKVTQSGDFGRFGGVQAELEVSDDEFEES